jgi:hypothetical protein
MTDVVAIFTGKDLNWMESEGGSGYWLAKTDRVKSSDYAIFIRNHRENWAVKDDGMKHGQAFMIGKISGCIKTNKYKGRKVIQLSEVALLPNDANFQKAWFKLTGGQRYPVAYLESNDLTEKLALDFSTLEWQTFNANTNAEKDKVESTNESINAESNDLASIIQDAKEMISDAAGISIDKVTIQISF